jgi:hypothetical protein
MSSSSSNDSAAKARELSAQHIEFIFQRFCAKARELSAHPYLSCHSGSSLVFTIQFSITPPLILQSVQLCLLIMLSQSAAVLAF